MKKPTKKFLEKEIERLKTDDKFVEACDACQFGGNLDLCRCEDSCAY